MPIKARCPYCKLYKLRAPDHAIGQSVTCKKCHNSFTIVETEDDGPKPMSPFAAAVVARLDRSHTEPTPLESSAAVADEELEPEFDITPEPPDLDVAADEAHEPEPAFGGVRRAPRRRVEPSLPLALVAFVFGSFGLMASQTVLAHWGAVAGAALGFGFAIFSLIVVRQKWVMPIISGAFNLLILGVVLLLPGWLNLRSWHPPSEPDVANTVFAVDHNGASAPAGDWVDAGTSSWQLGNARVSVGRVLVAPIELTGAQGKKLVPRENYVQLKVRVKNVGVFGTVNFKDWAPGTIRLTDSSGNVVGRKVFDGWEPSGRGESAKLGPSQSAETLLFFDAVPTNISYLRLELPGEAFGAPGVVRLQIPMLLVHYRPSP